MIWMPLSPPPPSSRDARSIHYMLGTGSDPGGPRINETDPAPTLREATDIGQELQGEKGLKDPVVWSRVGAGRLLGGNCLCQGPKEEEKS